MNNSNFNEADKIFMSRAIELAKMAADIDET